ncbi:nucleotide disphospho-sugar-binding domain-containing protein [Micromonospora sp. PTRAS2]
MRILFTTAPMYGHLLPLVPLARAARAAGHDVLFAAPADFAAVAAGLGLNAAASAPPVPMGRMMGFDRAGAPIGWPTDPEQKLERSGRGFARLAATVLDRLGTLVRQYRPDLIVSEPTEYAGRILAARHSIPWVEHQWGLATSRAYPRAAQDELRPELAAYGVAGLPGPDAVIDVCPASLQLSDAPPALPMRYVPVGGAGLVPGWLSAPRTRPRVCVTFGTVFAAQLTALVTRVVRAVAELDVEIVLAAGSEVVSELEPRPARVRAAAWLPLDVLLAGCDLTVHHGGPGTALTSVVHGVPQLILPQASDTAVYAEQLAAAGVARSVGSGAGPAEIAQAVTELLTGGGFRQAAAALAREAAGRPAPSAVLPALEALAAG